MGQLENKKCKPCSGEEPTLKADKIKDLIEEIKGWNVVEMHHLEKNLKFKNFKSALDFVNLVGDIAEQEQHHPQITFTWGKVNIQIWTHALDGLHENDFILAKKIDSLNAD